MDAAYREEDLKGAALFLSERSLLMGACMIFYIIFCIHVELINFPLLESPSEDHFCQNFDVSDTNTKKKNWIMPFIFMFNLKCNSRAVEYYLKCEEICYRKQFTNNLLS